MGQETEAEVLKGLIEKHKEGNEYLSSLNIHVGRNDHERVVQEAAKLGKKLLFVTGSRAMRRYGFLETYLDLFREAGLEVMHYDNIEPNPTLKQMEEGLAAARKFEPDFIFALGGGSVIDTAKAISVGLYGNIWDYVEKKAEIEKAIPIVASATTSGTGSHVTSYAVVTKADDLEKKTLKHSLLLPRISAADLDITRHMPPEIIASTGFDVMCHASEVYTRKDCTEAAAEFCTNALRLVRENLVAAYNGDSDDSLMGMIYADIYAGIALALVGTHAPHAISHPISARFPRITHGKALAYVFTETSRKQIENGDPETREKFMAISDLLGGSSDFVRTILNYKKLLGLDETPRFSEQDCEGIYLDTIGYRWPSVKRSPAGLTQAEVRNIIRKSLLG